MIAIWYILSLFLYIYTYIIDVYKIYREELAYKVMQAEMSYDLLPEAGGLGELVV